MLTPAQIKARYATRREQQHKVNHLYEPPVVLKEEPDIGTILVDGAKRAGITEKQILYVLGLVGLAFDESLEMHVTNSKQLVARIKALEDKLNGNTSGR